MKFYYGLSAALIGTAAIVIVQPEFIRAEEVEKVTVNDISDIAKEITVSIEGQQNTGSGVIIAKRGNTYYVLTAAHVVAYEDSAQIVTRDRMRYPLVYSTVRKLPEVDLAILEFTSGQSYRIATLADYDLQKSIGISVVAPVFISGWPASRRESQPLFSCGMTFKKDIASFLSKDLVIDGYELAYTNLTQPGMSGGPILDNNGQLIGIHGRSEGEEIYGEPLKMGFSLGIPTRTFLKIASQVGILLPWTVEKSPPKEPESRSWSGKDPCETSSPITNTEEFDEVDWANRGNELWRLFKLPEALAAYDRALKKNPNFYQAWYGKGIVLNFLNRSQEALNSFEKAFKILNQIKPISPGDTQRLQDTLVLLLRYQGNMLSALERYQEALELYDKAIQINPKYYVMWVMRANVLQSLNRNSEAIAAYDRAIQIEPRALTFISRGTLYFNLGEQQKAIEDFSQAIRLNPYDPQNYAMRGAAREKLGDMQGAREDFHQVEQLSPNYSHFNIASFVRGQARFTFGDTKRGIEDLSGSFQGFGGSQSPVMQAYIKSGFGDSQGALQDLNRIIRQNPNEPGAYTVRSLIRSQLGDMQGALEDVNWLVQNTPDEAQPYIFRSAIRERLGDRKGASEDFNQFIRLNPNQAEAYMSRGAVRLQLGDRQGALTDLQKAAKLYQEQGDMDNYEQIVTLVEQLQQLPNSR